MVQMTSDIALSGVACTSGVTPRQLVQSSSENDIWFHLHISRSGKLFDVVK
ncbi:NTP-binding protein [Shewanella sp. LC6]